MSDVETTAVETPVAAKPAKRATKKAAGKKATKKVAKKAAPAKSESGPSELQARRIELVRVLRKGHATSGSSAMGLTVLAERMKLERREVYGLVNGLAGKAGSSPTCLVATGHVKVATSEEDRTAVYLTAKGQKTDFNESPFSRS